MSVIYTHGNCPFMAHTPLQMLTHFQTAHAADTKIILQAFGYAGLDAELVKHRLHLTPFQGTRVYPCDQCSLLHKTSFESQVHLERAPAHELEVAYTRCVDGDVGLAALIITGWLEPVEEYVKPTGIISGVYHNEIYEEFNINQDIIDDASIEAGPVPLSTFTLTVAVSKYSARENFPKRVRLVTKVPYSTSSVSELAACFEATWVRGGHKPKTINWDEMIRTVGVRVGPLMIKTDAHLAAWIPVARRQEVGKMSGTDGPDV